MADVADPREINKRIAEYMGWTDLEWRDELLFHGAPVPPGWQGIGPLGYGFLLSDYAHSMDDLAPVIEKLRREGRFISAASVGERSFAADVYDKGNGWLATAAAETMAMATCLAIIDYLESKGKP